MIEAATRAKRVAKVVEVPETEVNDGRRKCVSHRELAELLRDRFPNVFETRVAAKQVVDIVLGSLGDLLVKEGQFCFREIGTLRVTKPSGKLNKDGKPVVRKRPTFVTSWSLLNRLNPDNPKKKSLKKG